MTRALFSPPRERRSSYGSSTAPATSTSAAPRARATARASSASWPPPPRAQRRAARLRHLLAELGPDPLEPGVAWPERGDLAADFARLFAIAVHDGHAEAGEVAVVRVHAVAVDPRGRV